MAVDILISSGQMAISLYIVDIYIYHPHPAVALPALNNQGGWAPMDTGRASQKLVWEMRHSDCMLVVWLQFGTWGSQISYLDIDHYHHDLATMESMVI